jgi:glycosyltransferase involved in cell wall biosynthesis
MAAPPLRLSIVLPAHNEEDNIRSAVDKARSVATRLCDDYEIVVVNDGSKDRTAAIVNEMHDADPRVRLVTHEVNRGYGEALRTGFESATLDLVFFTDADNQFDLDEIEQFLHHIETVDVVCGYRIERQDPLIRRFFAKGWNVLVRALFYVPVRDIDCAFKLFRRTVFDRIDLESIGAMVNTELMVKVARSGASVVEIGVTHLPRTAGRPSGANPKVIGRAFVELWRMRERLRQFEVSRGKHGRTGPA